VTGADLAQRAATQALKFKTELLIGQEVTALRREDPYRYLALSDGTELGAKSVVIATGMSARKLDVPGVEDLQGVGVYYGAALTEAARYRDKEVCIVGGANSAGQGALFFSRYASRVTILARAPTLEATMSRYLIDRIALAENIDVRCGVIVESVEGDKHLESVVVRPVESGEPCVLPSSAMFIFIGVRPHTEAFADVLERDEGGFILTGTALPREHGRPRGWTLEREPLMFETSIPGVYAAGDVRAGSNRRVAAAVGEGSATVHSIHQYLRTA
jgi:thioredoxin reductase (NADPH)